MNYKGIIFDLDGTLDDTLEDIAGSVNHVLELHGYPVHPINHYKLLVGRGLDNLVKQALPETARETDIVSVLLAEMIAYYDAHCLVKTHLYEGIYDVITRLSAMNIKLAVFSNKAEPLTVKIVDYLLGNISFVKVAGARPDVPKKPDPAGVLDISRIMGIKPDWLLYAGDSDVDMMTANRAGITALGVSWGFRSKEELQSNGADFILDHPQEILPFFQ